MTRHDIAVKVARADAAEVYARAVVAVRPRSAFVVRSSKFDVSQQQPMMPADVQEKVRD